MNEGPKVVCDSSPFPAHTASSAGSQIQTKSLDLEQLKHSEVRLKCDPSLILDRQAKCIRKSKSEKETVEPTSDDPTPNRQESGSSSSLSSTAEIDRKQLVINESLNFPSEDRLPAGSADCVKDPIQFSDSSLEVEQDASSLNNKTAHEDSNAAGPSSTNTCAVIAGDTSAAKEIDTRNSLNAEIVQQSSKNDEPLVSKTNADSTKNGGDKSSKKKLSKLKKLVNGIRKEKGESIDKIKEGKNKKEKGKAENYSQHEQQRIDNLNALNEYLSKLTRDPPDGCSDNLPLCRNADDVNTDADSSDEFENAPTRTISTVTLGKKRMHKRCKHQTTAPVQLYSIGRGALPQPAMIENGLVVTEILPDYAKNEKVLLPKDSAPPNKRNDQDRYGYLNTTLKEIKVAPKPIYTVGRDAQATEIGDFDELPSQRGIWTPISCCDMECFPMPDDLADEPSSLSYGFGEPNAAKHANDWLSLYIFNKVYKQTVKAAVNPHDKAREDRETVGDYIRTVDPDRPNVDQRKMIEKLEKKGIEKRIRRKIEEGSYSNFSVDERKLFGKKDTILRYTWKGKLVKLKKLLKDPLTHKYINRQDYCGRTALHYAASWDSPQITKLLLSIPGINVNLQDGDRKTPLRKACEIRSFDCVKLLTEFGANMRIVGVDRRNPFEYLIQEQGDEAIKIAMYLYNSPQIHNERTEVGVVSYLHQLCLSNVKVTKLAEELIKAGASINATEGSGRTPLISAVMNDRLELVELFLRYKADVQHIDMEYCNALKYAIPGEACHKMLKKAMALQPKSKAGRGLINGRLKNSESFRKGKKVNIICSQENLNHMNFRKKSHKN